MLIWCTHHRTFRNVALNRAVTKAMSEKTAVPVFADILYIILINDVMVSKSEAFNCLNVLFFSIVLNARYKFTNILTRFELYSFYIGIMQENIFFYL